VPTFGIIALPWLSLASWFKQSLKNKQEIGHVIKEEIGALGAVCDVDGGAGFGLRSIGY
jgi:hypothetical protein